MVTVEQCGPFYRGWVDGVPITHILNSGDAESMGEEFQVGEECDLFINKKKLKKAAKRDTN